MHWLVFTVLAVATLAPAVLEIPPVEAPFPYRVDMIPNDFFNTTMQFIDNLYSAGDRAVTQTFNASADWLSSVEWACTFARRNSPDLSVPDDRGYNSAGGIGAAGDVWSCSVFQGSFPITVQL